MIIVSNAPLATATSAIRPNSRSGTPTSAADTTARSGAEVSESSVDGTTALTASPTAT